MPPTKEVLITFARDLSANRPEIMAFAEAMMHDGEIKQSYREAKLRSFSGFVNGPAAGQSILRPHSSAPVSTV